MVPRADGSYTPAPDTDVAFLLAQKSNDAIL